MAFRAKPISFPEACAFVDLLHRHHQRPQGHKFSIMVLDDDRPCGVAMVGRPVARMADDGWTAEVTRLCTDGTPNACSFLYGASARAAKAMGYLRIITYILAEEDGASLRAAGWMRDRSSKGGSWSREGREREDKHPLGAKVRWVRVLAEVRAA